MRQKAASLGSADQPSKAWLASQGVCGTLAARASASDLMPFVAANAWWEPVTFVLPDPGPWHLTVDTGTEDGLPGESEVAPAAPGPFQVAERSVVVFVRGAGGGGQR